VNVISDVGLGRLKYVCCRHGSVDLPGVENSSAKLLFVSHQTMFVMNADGTHQRRVVLHADVPSWSPDGRRIAFLRPGRPGIWTVNADGSHTKRITAGSDVGISFSPDGRRIVFARQAPVAGALNRVFVINADGSHQRRLGGETADGLPGWLFPPTAARSRSQPQAATYWL
jgi:Tol biopolymer transport system component